MTQIVLGTVTVVSGGDPKVSGPTSDPAIASEQADAFFIEDRQVSLREARALADFAIRQPTYLPYAGLALEAVGLETLVSPGARRVISATSKYSDGSFLWLAIQQSRIFTGGDQSHPEVIPYDLEQGRVGERPAAFFSHPVAASAMPGGQITVTHCLWEHEGFLMEIRAPNLSLSEMARIGESLV